MVMGSDDGSQVSTVEALGKDSNMLECEEYLSPLV